MLFVVLNDLVCSVFEIGPRLPRRVGVPLVPLALKSCLILESVAFGFPAVHYLTDKPFFMLLVAAALGDKKRWLRLLYLSWVWVCQCEV